MPTLAPPACLSRAEATRLYREAAEAERWPHWFVTADNPAFPGRHVARIHTMDHNGGVWLPGALVADTLEELVALLPRGLTREDRAPLDPPDVLEVWS